MPKLRRALTTKEVAQQQENLRNALEYLCTNPSDQSGKPFPVAQVAHAYNVKNYHILRCHLKGSHINALYAHKVQQVLSLVQKEVLLEWVKELSIQSLPVNKWMLCHTIAQIMGGRVKPEKNWIACFLKKYPSIRLGKASGLDPKRGKAFNKTTVQNYFSLLESVLETLDIPWENVWNMNKKGYQCGGGRHNSPEKFFIPRGKRTAYRQRSSNLELVTIIECINAVGGSTKPGFIFADNKVYYEWMEVDHDIM